MYVFISSTLICNLIFYQPGPLSPTVSETVSGYVSMWPNLVDNLFTLWRQFPGLPASPTASDFAISDLSTTLPPSDNDEYNPSPLDQLQKIQHTQFASGSSITLEHILG